jgi:alkylation response protein AidB-like acyl-CoA dehydrogenase
MMVAQAKLQQGGAFLMEEAAPETVFSPEDFSDELKAIGQMTSDFLENEIMPQMDKMEKLEPGISENLLRKLGELGMLGIETPEEYGGTDLAKTAAVLVAERLAPAGGFSTTYGAHQSIGTLPTVYFGNKAQKEKYLAKLNTAEIIGAYALTEPNAGSDALGGQMKAVLSEDGKHYVLDGTKMWITNAGFADLFTVFARVDGEKEKFSAFLVERTFEGVSTGAEEHKMGIKSSSTRMVILDKVRVPVENLLGEVGQGAKIAFNILNTGRFKLGAGGLGGAKNALEIATKYAQGRKQFGQAIANFGMIQEKLAEMAIRIFAVESTLYRTAGLIDEAIGDTKDGGEKMKCIEEYACECSISKVLGSELLDYVVDEGVQIHGGYGFSAEYPIERAYRDSRILRLYEGTNEINRMLIPGMLLKRAMKGGLPLMQAAQGVQKKVMDASLEEQNDGGILGEEYRAVRNLKNVVLMLTGTAAMKFGTKLDVEQELMARIADIIMNVYASESAILRTRKLHNRGEDTELMEQMTRVYVNDAIERSASIGRDAVCRLTEDEQEIAVFIGALKRFTRHATVNTVALRRSIAAKVLEASAYPVEA